jgi:hypothetical protein
MLPELYGKLTANGFFIYSACDQKYFEEFGKIFLNSALKNTPHFVHLHVFNPTKETIESCQSKDRVSLSYEFVDRASFKVAAGKWSKAPSDEFNKIRYDRTINAMSKGKDLDLTDRIEKTYYACVRFIRLAELVTEKDSFFAADIDAVIRKDIPVLPKDKDCYLHKITGKKARILAGGIYTQGNRNGYLFLKEFAEKLKNNIENDYLYWSLDQDVLDTVAPKYTTGDLPISLIDWDMKQDSAVWTAKGLRKDSAVFIAEQKKYMF